MLCICLCCVCGRVSLIDFVIYCWPFELCVVCRLRCLICYRCFVCVVVFDLFFVHMRMARNIIILIIINTFVFVFILIMFLFLHPQKANPHPVFPPLPTLATLQAARPIRSGPPAGGKQVAQIATWGQSFVMFDLSGV